MKEITLGAYGFPMMAKIIPEGRSGKFYIVHQTATEEHVRMRQLMGAISDDWTWGGFRPGTYCILTDDGKGIGMRGDILMSDTWLERFTNSGITFQANGHVLIAGLGIGFLLTKIVPNPKVENVTVIELEQDVINLVEPHIRSYLDEHSSKLRIIQADIFEWQPDRKYDVIYFDIWHNISPDNYSQTKQLHRRFKYALNRQNPRCWMGSWLRDYIRKLHYEENLERR